MHHHTSNRSLNACLSLFVALAAAGCGDDGDGTAGVGGASGAGGTSGTGGATDTPIDITDAVFDQRDGSCSAYAGEYTASVTDLGNSAPFTASMSIVDNGTACAISSNSIPNHDFNDGGNFATAVSEVFETFNVEASPSDAASTTELTLEFDNAIFRNGVKLDLLAAACFGVGNEPLGQERIGCMVSGTPWRYDPMSPLNNFGTDANNAHTQPDGAYHYHGDPLAMYDRSGATASGVIGFAADGYPIFGPFFDDNGTVRRATSSYALKTGARESQAGEGAFPGASGSPFENEDYNGRFIDDYEYMPGAGDLDECNGMTVDGQYGYYVTDTYPWVLKCFKGTPDATFRKR